MITLLALLGAKLGGLGGVYALASLVVVANAVLFYLLVLRAWEDRTLAAAAAILFALYPADTTRPLLLHCLGIQVALLLVLVAFHLFLSGWRGASYLLAAGSLLCYETFFPVFAAAPFLSPHRPAKRTVVRHGAVVAAILAAVAIARFLGGEGRVVGLALKDLAFATLNPVLGPLVSLGLFAYRSMEGLRGLGDLGPDLVLLPACAAVTAWLLLHLERGRSGEPSARAVIFETSALRLEGAADLVRLARIALVGSAMLMLAYPLTMTVPALAFTGRATRVHAAACLGACIVLGCLATSLLRAIHGGRRRRLAALAMAVYCALLLAAALGVQRDYAASWSQQRSFWLQVVRLCPDAGDGTIVLAEVSQLPGARPTGEYDVRALLSIPQIRTFSWTVPLVLPQLVEFPSEWSRPPRVYLLAPGWRDLVSVRDERLLVSPSWIQALDAPEVGRPLEAGNVIVLESAGGRLERRTGSIDAGGWSLRLKDRGPSPPPPYRPRLLYRVLVSGLRA